MKEEKDSGAISVKKFPIEKCFAKAVNYGEIIGDEKFIRRDRGIVYSRNGGLWKIRINCSRLDCNRADFLLNDNPRCEMIIQCNMC